MTARVSAAAYVAAVRQMVDEWHAGRVSLEQLRESARGAWSAAGRASRDVQSAVLKAIREEPALASALSLERNASSDAINIANPGDAEDDSSLYRFWFGQVGSTFVYVWGDSMESAFETAVEWLDDNDYAGHFTTITQDDLKAAAEDEGIAWDPEWSDPRWNDWDDPQFLRVVEAAEADLTVIGHTTLKHGTHLVSYEWGVDEITDPKEREDVALLSDVEEE